MVDLEKGKATGSGNDGTNGQSPGSARRLRRAKKVLDTQIIEQAIIKISHYCDDEYYIQFNGEALEDSVRKTGESAFGIVAVEVWVLHHHKLVSPVGGQWISPLLSWSNKESYKKLTDPSLPKYVGCEAQAPGFGLVGDLWIRARQAPKSSNTQSKRNMHEEPIAPNPLDEEQECDETSRNLLFLDQSSVGFDKVEHGDMMSNKSRELLTSSLASRIQQRYHHHGATLQWRSLETLWNDPDTPKFSDRLKYQLEVGIGSAAAVPFHEDGIHGLVVYYTRRDSDLESVGTIENQEFLFRRTRMIGVAVSCNICGEALRVAKQRLLRHAWQKFVRNLLQHAKGEGSSSLHETEHGSIPSFHLSDVERLWFSWKKKMATYLRKFRGGTGQVAPPLNLVQTMWTWLGSFCGLFLLSAYNEWIKDISDGKYELLIGPFGAAMTLLYGLHSAPASQPRNLILGQAVSGAVSLAFTYIPEDILPVWVRRAVGPAFSVSAMVFCGVTHPPAGAHAVLYASGNYDWIFYILVVVGAIISVAPAVLVNNLSQRRQYPVYWGYWAESAKNLWSATAARPSAKQKPIGSKRHKQEQPIYFT